MAMQQVEPMVQKSLFDEAVRVGERSVAQSNRYMRSSRTLADAVGDALELLKTGRAGAARERLEKSLLVTARILGADLGKTE